MAVELFTVLSIISVPASVNAGVLSFISSVFDKGSDVAFANTTDILKNSQNMALLRAAINPNPDPAKGGGNITIVGDMALLSEAGPSGTTADISDEKNNAHGNISLYVVREGDTLSQIAKMFGV